MTEIRILGIAGSLRKGSANAGLLRLAKESAPAGVVVDIFDLSPIPLYNGDVEAAGLPASVAEFRQAISDADALLIASPEYNYSIPGVLKNALDWASRPPNPPFAGKARSRHGDRRLARRRPCAIPSAAGAFRAERPHAEQTGSANSNGVGAFR